MAVLLTDSGRANFAALAIGSGAAISYVGWGSSTTAPARTDTTLGTEITPRVSATVTAATTSVSNDTIQVAATMTAAGSITVAEVGVFTASSGGVLVLHGSFSTRTLQSGDTLSLTFTIQFP